MSASTAELALVPSHDDGDLDGDIADPEKAVKGETSLAAGPDEPQEEGDWVVGMYRKQGSNPCEIPCRTNHPAFSRRLATPLPKQRRHLKWERPGSWWRRQVWLGRVSCCTNRPSSWRLSTRLPTQCRHFERQRKPERQGRRPNLFIRNALILK